MSTFLFLFFFFFVQCHLFVSSSTFSVVVVFVVVVVVVVVVAVVVVVVALLFNILLWLNLLCIRGEEGGGDVINLTLQCHLPNDSALRWGSGASQSWLINCEGQNCQAIMSTHHNL